MNDFVQDFLHLLTDPAHVALEFVFVLLDYLIIQTVVTRLKKHFHKDIADEHATIEAEHDLAHPREWARPGVSHDWVLVDGKWAYMGFGVRTPRLLDNKAQFDRMIPPRPYDYERDGS